MTAYYNEFDPKAAAGLRALIADGLIPPGEVDTRSIVDVRADDLRGFTQCHFFAGIGGWCRALDLASWSHDRSVWTGSCPCQPFSAAGKQKGGADHRDLWPVWFNLIRECRPAIVFGEQVASAIPHGWLDRVYSDMEGAGYACGAAVLPACAVNAPHRRDRLWYVAHRNTDGRATLSLSGLQDKEHHSESCSIVGDAKGIRPGRRQNDENEGRRELAPSDTGAGIKSCQDCPPPQSLGDSKICGSDTDKKCRWGYAADDDKEFTKPIRSSGISLADSFSVGGCCGDNQREYAGDAYPSGQAGFWDEHDWIVCADGKARRIPAAQSGIRLLAHGVSERVGLLRTAGNAIVPEEAGRFITAAREAIEA